MTVEYLAYQLIAGYGKDSNVTSFVDNYDFYLIPVVNPDGFVYSQTQDRLWRKHRAPPLPGATLRALQAHLDAARALGLERVPGKGSNDWVIGGERTASGKPILADDPHLTLTSPMLWYLADLQGPTLRSIGASIPGLPGIVIGRNDRIAWGVTNVNPDVQDLYVEPASARHPRAGHPRIPARRR